MAANHKLTAVLKGRKIVATSNADGQMTLTFDDSSIMTVKTSGNMNASKSGEIKGVRQSGTTLTLDFEDGSSLAITMEEATSSVMVRDKNKTLEYAD